MPRKEFTRKVRSIIHERAGGKCQKCDAVLKPREGEYDHIIPLILGGESKPANGQLLCKICHKAKSAKDIGRKSKADRQGDKHKGIVRPKGQMQSRGFTKTDKPKKPKSKKPPVGPPALARQFQRIGE